MTACPAYGSTSYESTGCEAPGFSIDFAFIEPNFALTKVKLGPKQIEIFCNSEVADRELPTRKGNFSQPALVIKQPIQRRDLQTTVSKRNGRDVIFSIERRCDFGFGLFFSFSGWQIFRAQERSDPPKPDQQKKHSKDPKEMRHPFWNWKFSSRMNSRSIPRIMPARGRRGDDLKRLQIHEQ